jgi:hypothetical protein
MYHALAEPLRRCRGFIRTKAYTSEMLLRLSHDLESPLEFLDLAQIGRPQGRELIRYLGAATQVLRALAYAVGAREYAEAHKLTILAERMEAPLRELWYAAEQSLTHSAALSEAWRDVL